MDFRTYKTIKSLKPTDLFEILSRGQMSDYYEKFKQEVKEIKGEWYLNNWRQDTKIDILSFYISDTAFQIFVERKDVDRVLKLFETWAFRDRLFVEVYKNWYNDTHYQVGFIYKDKDFEYLYKQWLRDKNLELLLK